MKNNYCTLTASETEFEIYHRPLTGEYFRGVIKSWQGKFIVTCTAVSGGNRKYSVLDITDYKHKDKAELLRKIRGFAKRHNFKFKYLK